MACRRDVNPNGRGPRRLLTTSQVLAVGLPSNDAAAPRKRSAWSLLKTNGEMPPSLLVATRCFASSEQLFLVAQKTASAEPNTRTCCDVRRRCRTVVRAELHHHCGLCLPREGRPVVTISRTMTVMVRAGRTPHRHANCLTVAVALNHGCNLACRTLLFSASGAGEAPSRARTLNLRRRSNMK